MQSNKICDYCKYKDKKETERCRTCNPATNVWNEAYCNFKGKPTLILSSDECNYCIHKYHPGKEDCEECNMCWEASNFKGIKAIPIKQTYDQMLQNKYEGD